MLQRSFGLDARALVFLRCGLGLLVLVDLAMRAGDLGAHYTDAGIWPRALADQQWLSVYWLSGSLASAAALFALTAVAAVVMMSGRLHPSATALTWLLVLSLQNRVPALYHSGDALLRLALFWSLFLPHPANVPAGRPVLTAGTIAFTVQVALVFLCALDFKLLGNAWSGGWAVRDALSVTLYARPLAAVLAPYRGLQTALTYLTLVAQGVLPLLLLLPVRSPWPKVAGVAGVVAMQLSFGLFLKLGTFPFIVSTCALALLPAEVWRYVPIGLPAPRTRLVPPRWHGQAKTALAAASLALVALWNLGEAGATVSEGELDVPLQFTAVGRFTHQLGLNQRWAMFSPNPQTIDGHFELSVGLEGGGFEEVLSQITGGPHMSHRWLLYLLDLEAQGTNAQVARLLDYACTVDARFRSAELTFIHFDHLRDGSTTPESTTSMGKRACAQFNL